MLTKETELIETLLSNSIADLEKKIIQALHSIDVNEQGEILALSHALAQAKAVQKEVNRLIIESFETNSRRIDRSLTDINEEVENDLDSAFTVIAGASLLVYRRQIISAVKSMFNTTQDRINLAVLDHVTNRKTRTGLIEAVGGILRGSKSKTGRPMETFVVQIAQDGLMDYYAHAMKTLAIAKGVKKFKYVGSLIKDSRQWCIDHLNKVYTLEEIAKFDNDSWAGKKSGSTIVVRGGYNCRHAWLPVIDT